MLEHRVKRLEERYGLDLSKLSDEELIARFRQLTQADEVLIRLLTDPDIELPEVPKGAPVDGHGTYRQRPAVDERR